MQRDWMALTIRMPRELHEVLRILSFEYRVSINQITLEMLIQNIDNLKTDPSDPDSPRLGDEPEIAEHLEAVRSQVNEQFLKEFG